MRESELFRKVLLGSTRVVLPAPLRIMIHADSRLAVARRYLALMASFGEDEIAALLSFEADLERLAAAWVDAERPEHLLTLQRHRDLLSGLKRGMRRLDHVLEVAHRIVDHDGDVLAATAARTERRKPPPGTIGEVRQRDVLAREILPFLPFVHLAMPLVARWRQPAFAARYPELAPAAIPSPPFVTDIDGRRYEVHCLVRDPPLRADRYPRKPEAVRMIGVAAGLALNDQWPFAALHAAEDWRQKLQLPYLIEVRARWTGD